MQIGYHDAIDDSVGSGWWEYDEANNHLKQLVASPDVDSVWIRAFTDGTPFYIKRDGKTLSGKDK